MLFVLNLEFKYQQSRSVPLAVDERTEAQRYSITGKTALSVLAESFIKF
jgi:hypothetical protein